jgi:hypothetical protein
MDDEDGRYLWELLGILGDSSAWAARTSTAARYVDPAPGSPMRRDDNRAHPYELSHAAWHSLGHAVDHLCCLRALLGDAKVVPMYAPFSLVRAVLENACSAELAGLASYCLKPSVSSPGTLALTRIWEETMAGTPPTSSRVTVAATVSRSGTVLCSPSRSASAIAWQAE